MVIAEEQELSFEIEFLHRKEELKNEYDWVINNCKTFANSVFDEFVV